MLESTLRKLTEAINNRKFKSHQACFNFYLADLLEVKNYYTWGAITDFINTKTHQSLSAETYKVMLKRAKNKNTNKLINSTVQNGENKITEQKNTRQNTSQQKTKSVNPADLKELRRQHDLDFQNFINEQ